MKKEKANIKLFWLIIGIGLLIFVLNFAKDCPSNQINLYNHVVGCAMLFYGYVATAITSFIFFLSN